MTIAARPNAGHSIALDLVAAFCLVIGVGALAYAAMIDLNWLSHGDRRTVEARFVSREVYTSDRWVPDDDSDDRRTLNPRGEDWDPFNKDKEGEWQADYEYVVTYEYFIDDVRHTFYRGYSSETPPEKMKVHVARDDDGEWEVAEDSNTLIPWVLVAVGALWFAPRIFGRLRARQG